LPGTDDLLFAFWGRSFQAAQLSAETRTWRAITPPSKTIVVSTYATSGHLLTHKESIELFKRLGVKMTPEAKSPVVTMPFDGFTQQAFIQKIIDEYKAAGVHPRHVFPQSFDRNDILYWIQHEPAFGKQAVYLDDANVDEDTAPMTEDDDAETASSEQTQ